MKRLICSVFSVALLISACSGSFTKIGETDGGGSAGTNSPPNTSKAGADSGAGTTAIGTSQAGSDSGTGTTTGTGTTGIGTNEAGASAGTGGEGGSGTGSTTTGVGISVQIKCGSTTCDAATQLCFGATAGEPQIWQFSCQLLPSECLATPTCVCLAKPSACSCTETDGLRVSCTGL